MEDRNHDDDMTPEELEEREAIRSDLTQIAAYFLGETPEFLDRQDEDILPELWDRYREMSLADLHALRAIIREDVSGMGAEYDGMTGEMEITPMKYGGLVMHGALILIDFLIDQIVRSGPHVPSWEEANEGDKQVLSKAVKDECLLSAFAFLTTGEQDKALTRAAIHKEYWERVDAGAESKSAIRDDLLSRHPMSDSTLENIIYPKERPLNNLG